VPTCGARGPAIVRDAGLGREPGAAEDHDAPAGNEVADGGEPVFRIERGVCGQCGHAFQCA